jgi:hypothetical protein
MVTTPEEILLNNNIAPKAKERKFGHNKNIPYHVVKDLVSACLEYQKSGHTIEEFYHVKITSYYQGKFTFETFRKWVYGKQFE